MTLLAKDKRFWISNPRGHRMYESEHRPEDGTTVEWMGSEAVVIAPPLPPPDDWVCDICSEPILTRWGDEPFPVPMMGGYALCLDHFNNAVETWMHDTLDGDVSDVPMGEWPLNGCACQPCRHMIEVWKPMLYRLFNPFAA